MTPGRLLLGILLVCYPLIVYLTIYKLGPVPLGFIMILLLLLRGRIWFQNKPTAAWGSFALAAIAGSFLLGDDAAIVLKLYPVLINFGLLVAFMYTLFNPPSMIERIVRALRMPMSAKAGPYTRVVTMVWCGFFIVNGSIASLIAVSGSLGAWTIYNGLIAYIVMGVIIVGELIFRYFYKRRHGLIAERP